MIGACTVRAKEIRLVEILHLIHVSRANTNAAAHGDSRLLIVG